MSKNLKKKKENKISFDVIEDLDLDVEIDDEKNSKKIKNKSTSRKIKDNKKKKENKISFDVIEDLDLDVEIDDEKNSKKIKNKSINKKTIDNKRKKKVKKKNINDTQEDKIEILEGEEVYSKKKNNTFKKILLVILILSWFFVVFGAVYYYLLLPSIELKGNNNIKIEYGSMYSEKGYTANHFGKDVSKLVKVQNNINHDKIGEYEVTYSIKNKGFTRNIKRKVSVVDSRRPILKINSDDVYVCPGDSYIKEQVEALDNYDGDLSNKVKVELSELKDKVVYSVVDSSNNRSSVTKKILYEDKEKPVIKLNGSDTIYSFLGDAYNDPLYVVTDNCDKDISSKVTVEGSVDINRIGEYNLTYKVKDAYGNENFVSRKVIVRKREVGGTIYLTFDDGPREGTTNVILDILKEEGVKATFFVTNTGPDYLIKRMHDEGHTVALHTASHNYQTVYSSVEGYYNDLNSVGARVKRITGVDSKIIRFPGGSSNTVSRKYAPGIMSTLTQDVLNRGYRYYDWNISSGDAEGGNPSSSKIYNNVVNNLRRDRINMVLMHDIKTCTRDALRDIIRYGKNNGYSFDKITMGTTMVRQRVNN